MRRWLQISALAALVTSACKVADPPPITSTWYDGFDRGDLGVNYRATGDGYRLRAEQLSAKGAYNRPLWLRKKLPRNVRIDLEAWSTEPRGDIKIELFGDGRSFDPDRGSYTATGYVLIFGGWHNSQSMIAKRDEHGEDVVTRRDVKVVPGKHYHWRIERRGNVLRWFIDDMTRPFLELTDPQPLEGEGHEYFGFNNWETDTWFDNLEITPL